MLMLQQELKHQLDLIPVTTKTVIKILKIDESIFVFHLLIRLKETTQWHHKLAELMHKIELV